jgi:polar amino acid transport system substrate-binding protein
MKQTSMLAVRGATVLTLAALVLTACTNASETTSVSTAGSSGSAAATFDVNTVQKDDELASQVPAALKTKGSLSIGISPYYAPAQFLGGADSQTPIGYDIDLAKAISATLGLKADFQSADYPSIIPSLGSKFDIGNGSFTITEKRLQSVNFVSYFNAGTAWAVQKGNPKKFSVDDVCGKSVGVQTGTIQETTDLKVRNDKCLAENKSPIDIISLKTQADITTRLVNGSIDAMAADSPVTGYAIQQTNGTLEKSGEIYDAAPAGFAFSKGDTVLPDLVQKALTKLMADGTYKSILDQWNVADGVISKAEVNPAVS